MERTYSDSGDRMVQCTCGTMVWLSSLRYRTIRDNGRVIRLVIHAH